MNNNSQSQDDLIFQYLEGQTTMKNKTEFEQALKDNPKLQERFIELKMVHDSLMNGKLESPSSNFTSRVMHNLHTATAQLKTSPKNGLMLLLGVGVALMLGTLFLSTGAFDQLTGVLSVEQFNIPKSVMPQSMKTIPFNASLVMKVLIGLNLAIAFVLIDRTILQPYFRNRLSR